MPDRSLQHQRKTMPLRRGSKDALKTIELYTLLVKFYIELISMRNLFFENTTHPVTVLKKEPPK